MDLSEYTELNGGNMNVPLKKDNLIYKDAHKASETIHQLICHVRNKGITWIPESHGVNEDHKHVLTYIDGIVPHDTPDWLWNLDLLKDISIKLREWHDAAADFDYPESQWQLSNDEENEVICHSDFAPYNCVFKNRNFAGLIDFDVCAPGSRIWDISYTAYRFVPLLPCTAENSFTEISPFSEKEMIHRLGLFLESYSSGQKEYLYSVKDVIHKVQQRLEALSEWSRNFAAETDNEEILHHSRMYRYHAQWIRRLV